MPQPAGSGGEVEQNEARGARGEAAKGGGEAVCQQGGGGAGLAREPMPRRVPSRAKRRWAKSAQAFEAMRAYNMYNMYNVYIIVYFSNLCFGLRLVGSDGKCSVGRCGPARRAGRSVRPERTVVLPETHRPSGHSFATGRTQ